MPEQRIEAETLSRAARDCDVETVFDVLIDVQRDPELLQGLLLVAQEHLGGCGCHHHSPDLPSARYGTMEWRQMIADLKRQRAERLRAQAARSGVPTVPSSEPVVAPAEEGQVSSPASV